MHLSASPGALDAEALHRGRGGAQSAPGLRGWLRVATGVLQEVGEVGVQGGDPTGVFQVDVRCLVARSRLPYFSKDIIGSPCHALQPLLVPPMRFRNRDICPVTAPPCAACCGTSCMRVCG